MARGGERLERRDEETERMTKTEHTQSSPELRQCCWKWHYSLCHFLSKQHGHAGVCVIINSVRLEEIYLLSVVFDLNSTYWEFRSRWSNVTMTGGFFYSSPGNILELFQQITFTQRVSLTEKKPNKPDSTVCIFFYFFSPFEFGHYSAQSWEEAECGRWEHLDETAVTATLNARAAASPAEASPLWLVGEKAGTVGCTANTQTCPHWRRQADTYTCMGGFIAMATCDWSPELCSEREREY